MRTPLLSLCLLFACGGNDHTNPGDLPDAAIDGPAGSRTCGGIANAMCSDDEYCDYADNACGVADGPGTCKPRPGACPALVGHQVCGCDGMVHASECASYTDGSDLNAGGGCPKMVDKFACGYLLCSVSREYCRREPHTDGIETFTCQLLPATTCQAAPSCGCLSGERCGEACTGDDKLGLTLTCPSTPTPD